MIITKSISRYARNTLDTLKFVRMLKDKNIALFFEDENINTLSMDGELLLIILRSVAQQEVENISANVKKGLKMKMKRGELVGFQSCLGYDYDPNDKSISINEACGDDSVDTKSIYVEILRFKHFTRHMVFTENGKKSRNKEIKNYINVSVVVDIVCGNTKE